MDVSRYFPQPRLVADRPLGGADRGWAVRGR
jgi:hypothetical protein